MMQQLSLFEPETVAAATDAPSVGQQRRVSKRNAMRWKEGDAAMAFHPKWPGREWPVTVFASTTFMDGWVGIKGDCFHEDEWSLWPAEWLRPAC